ncbi:ribonuclease HI [Deinococcus psychrotolerans]|uniref:Ribonuclease H n=1 Tax=Deinococcus psychrotolerans TaxID=2489213 RepID=A0A3G8YB44_9DEIO|nr:ribonuclease HI [Deinococcus psychrotolerans]AZI42133.1 ribonuclease HI [Deinococcus psychrotolerans]
MTRKFSSARSPVQKAAAKQAQAVRDQLPLQACIQPNVPVAGNAVTLYSDGACDTQAGHGGWATLLKYGEHTTELCGHAGGTTNNRMELTGLLEGLKALKRPCQVRVVTDSQYLRKAFTDAWILKWQRNGWRTAGGDPVKNQDLWEELVEQAHKHALTFVWVKGHAGHAENDRVDELAVAERKKLRLA